MLLYLRIEDAVVFPDGWLTRSKAQLPAHTPDHCYASHLTVGAARIAVLNACGFQLVLNMKPRHCSPRSRNEGTRSVHIGVDGGTAIT